MAWRGLHLTRPARLSLGQRQIVVAQDQGEVRLALEDVAFIVLDTPQAALTSALLSACMEGGIAVVVTDAAHHPSGLMLPFHRHHRQAAVAGLQLAASAPLRKRLWQAVVRAKILNQAAALDAAGAPGAAPLRAMAGRVGSGDPGNVEAQAAREYWRCLFQKFRREDAADRRNQLLNYGYAVVRATVARGLVAAGLLPCLGLHHAGAANPFNLADDLVEPFRPFVDVQAWRVARERQADALTIEDRRDMVGVAMADTRLGEDTVTLLVAAERCAASLVSALEAKTPAALQLPRLGA
jgi:CRISPR-associated protein Cas1